MRRYKTPMFQHRHYAAIAHALAQTNASDMTIRVLAGMFARDNSNFQLQRFIAAACGDPCNKDRRS